LGFCVELVPGYLRYCMWITQVHSGVLGRVLHLGIVYLDVPHPSSEHARV